MSSVDRPRPRPRPRPKAGASSEHAAHMAGSSSGSLPEPVQISTVDSDEMFMRNRNRTTNTWATLEKLTKEVKTARNSDSDEEISTPRRKKARKKKDGTELWQNKKHITRLLSQEIPSSDDDDGVEIVGTSTTPRAHSASQQKRSRSRSITPPPELPRAQIQHMRALVEQTLNAAPSPPRFRDDDIEVNDDALFTNPELAKLAKSVRSHASSQVTSPTPEGRDTVQVAVRWKPHPLNSEGREALWLFKMNRDDNFEDLFEATAEEACIRVENLILTYEGRRIYASVSPMTFQMWGEVELVGCDKVTYEYLRTHPPNTIPEILSDTDAPSPSQAQDDEDERTHDSEAEGETYKLILRSSVSTKDITLTVRPTTKCGAIVKAYLKKAGLADQYPGLFNGGKNGGQGKKDPRLCVDGDKMGNDVEIGDADLEDGDMVEVVGL